MPDPSGADPAVFLPSAVAEETRAFNAHVRDLLSQAPPTHTLEPAVIRAAREQGSAVSGPLVRLEQAQQRTIEANGLSVPVRVFVPDRVDGVYLYIHGGGWVLGAADGQDVSLWETATTANVAVISVEYRLAPEHPYPAGPDDCEAAATWLVEHARAEFGTDRLTIGGGSAGGHLAAATLLRMRDRHDFRGFAGANLVFGVYDLSMTPSQQQRTDGLLIPTATMAWFYDHFLGAEHDRRDPDISPLYAHLQDMPPALFTVGTEDPLLDDTLFMYQRWRAAGNAAELAVYPGGIHGFTGMPVGIAKEANARSNAFLRAAVGA
jgi:acetyl esterase/lipase